MWRTLMKKVIQILSRASCQQKFEGISFLIFNQQHIHEYLLSNWPYKWQLFELLFSNILQSVFCMQERKRRLEKQIVQFWLLGESHVCALGMRALGHLNEIAIKIQQRYQTWHYLLSKAGQAKPNTAQEAAHRHLPSISSLSREHEEKELVLFNNAISVEREEKTGIRET